MSVVAVISPRLVRTRQRCACSSYVASSSVVSKETRSSTPDSRATRRR